MASELTKSSRHSWVRKLQRSPLSTDFYSRDTLSVARDLLGKILIVDTKCLTVSRIVEVEAYSGDDPASHSSRGMTPRCAPMFEVPGRAYVYFIYGMYEMLNFVTEPKGQPGAVLIRAVEPLVGLEGVGKLRTNGPGKLTRALGVEMSHNREPLQGPRFWVADDGFRPPEIAASGRIGIREATERQWRFFVPDHPCVSREPRRKN